MKNDNCYSSFNLNNRKVFLIEEGCNAYRENEEVSLQYILHVVGPAVFNDRKNLLI